MLENILTLYLCFLFSEQVISCKALSYSEGVTTIIPSSYEAKKTQDNHELMPKGKYEVIYTLEYVRKQLSID